MKCTDCCRYLSKDCAYICVGSDGSKTLFFNDRVTSTEVDKYCRKFAQGPVNFPLFEEQQCVVDPETCVESTAAGFGTIFDMPIQNEDIQIQVHQSSELKDSGERREFETGAVRDIVEGKGRCDLMPLHEVSIYLDNDQVIEAISRFMRCGEVSYLYAALKCSIDTLFDNKFNQMLEVAKQYEAGAKKYGEHNWEKGIPLHSYIDSGVRHYLKCLRGDADEPHDRAFVWNILGAIWTLNNKPEMNDIQYSEDMK